MSETTIVLPAPEDGLVGSEVVAAERALLASILHDERVLAQVAESVQQKHFYEPRLAGVFGGMLGMRAAGEPINHVTVAGHLEEWGVRGIGFVELHSWADDVATSANAPWLAAQVRDSGMMREAAAVVQRLLVQQRSREPGTAIANTIEDLRQVAAGAGGHRHAYTLDELLALDTSHDWLIPGLLERQDRLMLTGIEGLGKSTLLQQIAFAAAAGVHPFNEHQRIPARQVLFVDAENSLRQWSRKAEMLTRRLAPHRSLLDANVHVHTDLSLSVTDPATVGQLHRLIDEHQPDILVIGPIYRIAGGSLNDEDVAAQVLNALDTFRARGIALLMEAHAGHSHTLGGDRNLRPRGSSALLGWPEFGLGLRNTVQGDMQACELVAWRGAREERAWPTDIWRNTLPHGLPWKTDLATTGGTPWTR